MVPLHLLPAILPPIHQLHPFPSLPPTTLGESRPAPSDPAAKQHDGLPPDPLRLPMPDPSPMEPAKVQKVLPALQARFQPFIPGQHLPM